MAQGKFADKINMPIAALFAVGVTFYYPQLSLIAWIIFAIAAVIKIIDL